MCTQQCAGARNVHTPVPCSYTESPRGLCPSCHCSSTHGSPATVLEGLEQASPEEVTAAVSKCKGSV